MPSEIHKLGVMQPFSPASIFPALYLSILQDLIVILHRISSHQPCRSMGKETRVLKSSFLVLFLLSYWERNIHKSLDKSFQLHTQIRRKAEKMPLSALPLPSSHINRSTQQYRKTSMIHLYIILPRQHIQEQSKTDMFTPASIYCSCSFWHVQKTLWRETEVLTQSSAKLSHKISVF